MNRRIFRLFVLFLCLFLALLVNLNWIQVVQADRFANDPRNVRSLYDNYSRFRGPIVSADGVVLARTVETRDQLGYKREYPTGGLFAHPVGFVSFEHGEQGVERTYRGALVGTDPTVSLRPANLLEYLTKGSTPATVKLSIPARAQQAAADALKGRRGGVAALDPRTGAVLALYANPTYDPNPIVAHDKSISEPAYDAAVSPANGKPMLSRAFQERVAPGSTFKVVTAATALQAGITPETAFPDPAVLDLPGTTAVLPNFAKGRPCNDGRSITLEQALVVSCNTTFGQLGMSLGNARLAAQAESFGFNSVFADLGVDSVPSVFPPGRAFEGNKAAEAFAAIGQFDVQATPLQMAAVAAGVANLGDQKSPRLVSQLLGSDGKVLVDYDQAPKTMSRPLDATRATQLREMMVKAVESGTGRAARIPGVRVGGKTGTTNDFEQAWFIGFAPAANPSVAVAVLIENDGHEATGGQVAAPAARHVMQEILAYQAGE